MPAGDVNDNKIPDWKESPAIGVDGSNPGVDLVPVTPHDTNVQWYRSLYLKTDGDIEVTTFNNSERTYPAGTFPVQTVIPLAVKRVKTGTTAVLFGFV